MALFVFSCRSESTPDKQIPEGGIGCNVYPRRLSAAGYAMQPLFKPFRALGYISDNVPFAVQRRGKETFVTVSVGKAWQVRHAYSFSAFRQVFRQ